MGVCGAEGHIVTDQQNRDALGGQTAEDPGKGDLELRVKALGGLIQQQNIGAGEQHLGQGGALLFAAGDVVGVPVQKGGQAAQSGDALYQRLLLLSGRFRAAEYLKEILPHRPLEKQRLGILGQMAHLAPDLHRAPVGGAQTGYDPQGGGFTGAVSAQQRIEFPLVQCEGETLYNVVPVLVVAEPQVVTGQGNVAAAGGRRLLLQRQQRLLPGAPGQKVRPVPHGERAGQSRFHPGPDPHGGGHGQEHSAAPVPELQTHLLRLAVADYGALLHDQNTGGVGEGLLQTVLRQDDGGAQLPVDLAEDGQKVRGGNGIQLRGGLVQHQHIGLHGHDGGQAQKLLLPAGKLGDAFVKPWFNAEEGGDLRHAAADGGGVAAQALQAEGQLVPHLVRDHLILRRLQHKADGPGLLPLGQLTKGGAAVEDLSGKNAVRGQTGLQMPQKRGFSAPGGAAQDQKLPLLHGEAQVTQSRSFPLRVGEGHIFE